MLILAVVIFGIYTVIRDAEKVDQLLIDLYQGQDELKVSGYEIKFEDILSQGKPTVLNFWGGDCPPCRAEMPDLQRSYETNRDDVRYFGMDSGRYFGLGTPRSAKRLIDELSVTYPDAEGNLFRR